MKILLLLSSFCRVRHPVYLHHCFLEKSLELRSVGLLDLEQVVLAMQKVEVGAFLVSIEYNGVALI